MTYNLPALYALAKKNPDAALAVFHRLRDESYSHVEAAPLHDGRDANVDDAEVHVVPDEPLTSETMSEMVQDGPDEIAIEVLHEVRPSIDEMLKGLGWIEWPWCGERDKKGRYKRTLPFGYAMQTPSGKLVPAEGGLCDPIFDGHNAMLGGLTFYLRPKARRWHEGGLLVSYMDASGEERRPAYNAMKPRGGKRPLRTNPEAESYLALRGAVASPMDAAGLRTPMSGEPALGDYYHPTADAAANAVELADAYANTPVLPTATRCPTGIAKGARFMGGLKAANATASAPAPNWQEREVKPLGPVLEEVAARGSLADIGIRLGFRGGRPDRAGGRALLAAGQALIASNDNAKIKVAA